MKLEISLQEIGPTPVTVFHLIPADSVTVPLTVRSDQKTYEARFGEIDKAHAYIKKAAEKAGIQVQTRRAHVSTVARTKIFSQGITASTLFLRIKLKADSDNIFTGASALQKFMNRLETYGKAQFEVGQARLEVGNPESHRKTILSMIAEDVKRTLDIFAGRKTVLLQHLHRPVVSRPYDERRVALFIEYAFSLRAGDDSR
jgi:hypothetical protein